MTLFSGILAGALAASAGNACPSLDHFADNFDRAQIAQDADVLDAMVSEDLVFIDGSGKRMGKKDFIAGWLSPETRFNPVKLTDRVIMEFGPDAGLVSAETILTGTSGGAAFSSHIRFSDSFRKEGGCWKAIHIQVTRIAPKTEHSE